MRPDLLGSAGITDAYSARASARASNALAAHTMNILRQLKTGAMRSRYGRRPAKQYRHRGDAIRNAGGLLFCCY